MKKTTILTTIATVLVLFSCKSNTGNLAQLTANKWQLKEMSVGNKKAVLPERVPSVEFADSNAMYGFSGCNRFFGKYTTEGNTIKIEPGGSTMMACPNLQFEDQFMKVFAQMTSYSITNKELKLTDKAKKQILIFVPQKEEQRIGVANDEHGCNAAAGYTWSEVSQECIRLFESGIRMLSKQNPEASSAAFIVFAPDSSKVELFLPGEEIRPILDKRSLPKGGSAWNIEDDDTYNVRRVDGKWIIEKRTETLFVQDPNGPVTITYVGGNGKNKMLYQITVTYFPDQEKAKVQYDDQIFELTQQVSASGVHYKNDQVDLIGKGKEIQFTLPDGMILKMNEK